MARINLNEMDNYETNNTERAEWLKLQNDGDVARVQFLYNSADELDIYACHTETVNGKQRYVDCKREYNESTDVCPLCKAGHPVKTVMVLQMLDHSDGKVKLWGRGRSFQKKIASLFNRFPDLSNHVFEIERHGAKGSTDTTYEIFCMDGVDGVEVKDVSDIEKSKLLGSYILDKDAEDMEVFLQTGEFPQTVSNNNYNNNGAVSRRDAGVSRRRQRTL